MTAPVTMLPENLVPAGQTPVYSQRTAPAAMRHPQVHRAGVWGRVRVVAGAVHCIVHDEDDRDVHLTAGDDCVIEPQTRYHLEAEAGAQFFVEYFQELLPPEATRPWEAD